MRILDWYDTPRWYDIVFDAGTKREADFLEALLREHGPRRAGSVLEPACGSGRLVAELARRGHAVTGLDLNPRMLAFAQQRLARRRLRARLLQGDMTRFLEPRRHALAHCLVSTFKYLLDEESARSHLECVARALVPDGIYVLGFHLTDYDETRILRERWTERRGKIHVTCNTQLWPADSKRRLEVVRARLVVQRPTGEWRSQTNWKFRTYDAHQVRRLLRSVPLLELVAVHDFHHDAAKSMQLDDDYLDKVLVLRRRR